MKLLLKNNNKKVKLLNYVINFISTENSIHKEIKYIKIDALSEVEEKLYQIDDNFRDKNKIRERDIVLLLKIQILKLLNLI